MCWIQNVVRSPQSCWLAALAEGLEQTAVLKHTNCATTLTGIFSALSTEYKWNFKGWILSWDDCKKSSGIWLDEKIDLRPRRSVVWKLVEQTLTRSLSGLVYASMKTKYNWLCSCQEGLWLHFSMKVLRRELSKKCNNMCWILEASIHMFSAP